MSFWSHLNGVKAYTIVPNLKKYDNMNIKELIAEGKKIESLLQYVPAGEGVIRMYPVYRPTDVDEYYRWKEFSIRFLKLYYPTEEERFFKYSEEFEKHHYLPHYISNMIGVLEACKVFPSESMTRLKADEERESEIVKVQDLEQQYLEQTGKERVHLSTSAFHDWHAAACVLFDKWFYPTDEDWVKFQDIDGGGNGYALKYEYDKIYSSYQILIARLKDGRGLKGMARQQNVSRQIKKTDTLSKVNIFISYAHADLKWLERLKKHLKVLAKYSGSVEYWEDTKMRGGDKWRDEITAAINKANVAILLVSTDFLASDFIASDELPPILRKAVEEGTRVLPLIVAPCSFEVSEISDFQAINSPDRTLADLANDEAAIDRVYLELVKTIQGLL